MTERVPVYLETGAKRTFAVAVEWPGWARSGRTEEDALAALVEYSPRYARSLKRAAADLTPPGDIADLDVVDRVKGDSGTEFGVPSISTRADERAITAAELDRLIGVLEASWRAVERAAAAAEGVELSKGPRGGGRDLDKIVEHVAGADEAYLGAFGSRIPKDAPPDPTERWVAVRSALLDEIRARVGGAPEPPMGPRRKKPLWQPRYLIRRSAWHALDHAWELEDRAVR